jgi:hypothetical protein
MAEARHTVTMEARIAAGWTLSIGPDRFGAEAAER